MTKINFKKDYLKKINLSETVTMLGLVCFFMSFIGYFIFYKNVEQLFIHLFFSSIIFLFGILMTFIQYIIENFRKKSKNKS